MRGVLLFFGAEGGSEGLSDPDMTNPAEQIRLHNQSVGEPDNILAPEPEIQPGPGQRLCAL